MSETYVKHMREATLHLRNLMHGTDSDTERNDIVQAYLDALASYTVKGSISAPALVAQTQVADETDSNVEVLKPRKRAKVADSETAQ